jgi:zinc finger protein 830
MRLQRIRDGTLGRPPGAPAPELQQQEESEHDEADEAGEAEPADGADGEADGLSPQTNKRKADDGQEMVRKKSKVGALPEDFFDKGVGKDPEASSLSTKTTPPLTGNEIQLPSRPATPLKPLEVLVPPKASAVDEDEWAAFEADIAAVEAPPAEEAVISAPAMSAEELAAQSREEESAMRKEQQEAELEGNKEDAARKLEDEFQEMEALEERVRKLKEKREALRLKDGGGKTTMASTVPGPVAIMPDAPKTNGVEEDGEDEDDEDEDDDWDGFRLKA